MCVCVSRDRSCLSALSEFASVADVSVAVWPQQQDLGVFASPEDSTTLKSAVKAALEVSCNRTHKLSRHSHHNTVCSNATAAEPSPVG